jgi:hypothetical protein
MNVKFILYSITLFRKSCSLWDSVEKYGRARQVTDDNVMRLMRFACWITKITVTHSEYVILIACPRQKWLRERALILRLYFQYIACLVQGFPKYVVYLNTRIIHTSIILSQELRLLVPALLRMTNLARSWTEQLQSHRCTTCSKHNSQLHCSFTVR